MPNPHPHKRAWRHAMDVILALAFAIYDLYFAASSGHLARGFGWLCAAYWSAYSVRPTLSVKLRLSEIHTAVQNSDQHPHPRTTTIAMLGLLLWIIGAIQWLASLMAT